MAQSESSLATVEECRRKSCEFFNDSSDGFFALTTRGFEAVKLLLSESSDRNHIQRALISLDAERKLSMQFDVSKADPARIVTYGFIESAQLVFLHLIDKIDSLQAQIDGRPLKPVVEKHAQTDMSAWDFTKEAMTIKTEELINEDEEHPSHNENANEIGEFPRAAPNSIDGLSTVPTFTRTFPKETKKEPVEPKEEPIDTTQTIPGDKQNSDGRDRALAEDKSIKDETTLTMGDLDGIDQMIEGGGDSMADDVIEKGEGKDNSAVPKESSDSVEVEQRRRSSRVLGGGSMKDSDGQVEPSAKKSRSEKKIEKTTPKCVLCEVYPNTLTGYMKHLRVHDKSTLIANGIFLKCHCGLEVRTYKDSSHSENCDRRQFTLHEFEEKTTPQCIMCEAYPSTTTGYHQHLYTHHKSTLYANGIYLICECGIEVRHSNDRIHGKKCDRLQFSLHKLDEN